MPSKDDPEDLADQLDFYKGLKPTQAKKVFNGRMSKKSRIASMVKHSEHFRPAEVSLPKLSGIWGE